MWEELKHLKLSPKQGSGWSRIFFGKLDDKEVCVKVQIKGDVNGAIDERYEREVKALSLQHPMIPELIALGRVAPLGNPFIVMPRLYSISPEVFSKFGNTIATQIREAVDILAELDVGWVALMKHLMQREDGSVVIMDFNDDAEIIESQVEDLLKEIVEHSIEKIEEVEEKYVSLLNVHQPIYFEKYSHILRTETEKNDPTYGRRVPANRKCFDRLEMIKSVVTPKNLTYLDIGSDVGWFCFAMEDLGAISTGMEADKNKVEFCNFLSNLEMRKSKFITSTITPEAVSTINQYDIISSLSTLHWCLEKPPTGSSQISTRVSGGGFMNMLVELVRRTKKVFFLEIPPRISPRLGFGTLEGVIDEVCKRGKFSNYRVVGVSDNKRPMIAIFR